MSDNERTIVVRVLKFDPQSAVSKPHFKEYQLKETPSMTLFIALNLIREHQDPDLSFDFVCRAGICGSCAMMVNGRPRLACKTLTSSFESGVITLMPMPSFTLIKDLSVNTGDWFSDMTKRVESWAHSKEEVDITRPEKRIEPDEAQEVFELDRCIECGCCIASCGTKLMRPNFIGAAGMNRAMRFMIDSHDERSDDDFYELVGDDDGVFGCMSLIACHDTCPKELPLQSSIATLRNRMLKVGKSR
ncbi:fumarate reductase iron-sulfur subunit [Helicobacter pylori GAM83Bi]|uniref:fumarate reductase iron-sulfur subunit n=1 Tax=Helicobacter pylori TaxID=210 RepID=UPI0002BC3585|nr:fumarate reductase iron-sulfur subunit [Helicobacter pylori]EMG89290.1 fumarate reductase iron-sulfur subunit [Helicobacter pylori GAM201Ai]EMH37298.1 fumarate reductase iron-sulfur subunit [Helicobacter pylori GAM83Bi]EMH37838.1 fumarate reductase iron-sulfur subunit [Helicobacter pylori GAM83T]WQU01619.1 fumarate reductase iron-sulfur subunit [Helicobacter pylori]WQW48331.1 fumarate reductase iron-sulfur subunit [Helicobacter pylori]